jgi:phospholipase A-2-activating protein
MLEYQLLFSTVIDLSRLLAGFCHSAFATIGLKDRFFEALFKASEWNTSWALPLPKHRETNILLLFRTVANIFQEETSLDGTWVGRVFDSPTVTSSP